MKKAGLTMLAIWVLSVFNAQTLNSKGLYVDSDGELFNGTLSSVHEGVKSDLTVKEGLINGEATYYFASGKVMEKGTFTNGQKDQKWIRFNETGSTSAIAFYKLGKKTGTWLVYDEKGNKRFEMNYTDGEKTGTWTSWNENGTIASSKDYSKVN